MPKDSLQMLRWVGLVEGTSFLLLLGIAMPLKYALGIPMAVKVAGWIHGVLFLAYLMVLWNVWGDRRWPLPRLAAGFVAAVVPLGPFVFDRSLRNEAARASEEREPGAR